MNACITGRYTTRRGGVSYTYEATWHEAADGVVWSALVRRNGELVGEPNGALRNITGWAAADAVRRLVESAIENKQGVSSRVRRQPPPAEKAPLAAGRGPVEPSVNKTLEDLSGF